MSALTVLVIEDDVNMLQLLQLMLQRNNYQVSLSSRPQEGLEKALVERPNVIIVDLMMPEMSGFEVIRRLRADPRGADVPILVLTARAQPLDRKAALAAGADAYLSKPVSTRTLLDKVEELAARARPRQGGASGQVVVLFSLRGGVGVTTLAVNLAFLLQRAPKGACLVDLNRCGGHVALSLKLSPTAHWGALLQGSGEKARRDDRGKGPQGGQGSASDALTPDLRPLIPELLTQHGSGLHVLAAPPEAVQGEGLHNDTIQAVVRALRDRFSFTVVDAAPVLDETTLAALGQADIALLVLAPEVGSVHSAGVALRALAGTPAEPHVSLVMNHPTPLRPLPQANVEHSLGQSISLSVPFDETQGLALARGVPLALQPATTVAGGIPPLVKAVRDLAVHVAGFRLQTADLKS